MSIQDHHQESAGISLLSHMDLDLPSLELPMCSNENPPQLTLSDIMHHMSPSPVPVEDPRPEYSEMGGQILDGSQGEREGSPEPLTEADVVAMRRRLHALGFSLNRDPNGSNIGGDLTQISYDFGDATPKELVDMILRLIDPLSPDATQLERQADVISVLTSQRDFLMHQAEEDRNRWRSEREGWDRMAEALLSHRNKKSGTREDETGRQRVQLESENRALRDKLQDAQTRLSSLESELMKLKPLLLMQPYSVTHIRQNFASQPQVSSQRPNAALTTEQSSHRDVGLNKLMSDIKGKQREIDSASSKTQLEAISEHLETNEERGLGPSALTRSSHSSTLTPAVNVPQFSGATNSTADIHRPQYSYPYNHHHSTPSVSPSKSTFIPPKITLNSPPSSSTGHSQPQHYTTAESPFKPLGSVLFQIHPTTPSRSHSLPQATPTLSSQQRRSRDSVNHSGTTQNPPTRRRNHGTAPLTSDARTEHILLAARRIGRERAGLVAGIKQHAEREKEIHARELELIKARQDHERSEKERLERLANGTSGLAYYRSTDALTSPQQRNTGRGSAPAGTPRTPKRGGGVGATHYPALSGALGNSPISSPTRVPTSAGPSTFVFVNTSAVAGASGYSGGGSLSTPEQLSSSHKRSGTTRLDSRTLPSNPPTPLDSLLNAARSMMDDGAGSKAGGKINGTRKLPEHPESPVPKRRRVYSSGSKTLGRGGSSTGAGTATRVRSALDVLADQAAAAFDDDPDQTRRSDAKGKGKEKVEDDDSSDDGNGGIDNVNEGDDLDACPQGSTTASASAPSMGSGQGRSRTKTATRPTAEPTSISSMSLRPVRQASQKRLASHDLQPPPSTSMTVSRSKGRSRGRPKGSKSLPRSTVSVKTSKMNPSPSPRVIVSSRTHSSLDEVVASLPQKGKSLEAERSEEHPRWTTVDLGCSPGMGSSRLGSRPAVEWREMDAEEEEGDEDIEGEGEYVSLVVAGAHELGLDQNSHVEETLDSHAVEASNDKVTAEAEPGSTVEIILQDTDAETQINALSNAPTSDADVDLMTIPLVDTIENAEVDDEDAEGEQEEEDDENDDAGQDQSSRSRTPPPPPGPPHLGTHSNSNNDDPDADADAEGEMEFQEHEEFPPTSPSSAVYQNALSVPMGQVQHGKYDDSSWYDVWLIFFWIKPEQSFGNDTTSIHVLISAMIPESLPSSPSILSDLSEKMMTPQLAYRAEVSGQLAGGLVEKY